MLFTASLTSGSCLNCERGATPRQSAIFCCPQIVASKIPSWASQPVLSNRAGPREAGPAVGFHLGKTDWQEHPVSVDDPSPGQTFFGRGYDARRSGDHTFQTAPCS